MAAAAEDAVALAESPQRSRVYMKGPRAGQKYVQKNRAPFTRRGFNDSVDISIFPNATYESIIGMEMVVKCIGKRTYVGKVLAHGFDLTPEADVEAGTQVAAGGAAASSAPAAAEASAPAAGGAAAAGAEGGAAASKHDQLVDEVFARVRGEPLQTCGTPL